MLQILFTEVTFFTLFLQTTEGNTQYYVNPDCVYDQYCINLDDFASGRYDDNVTLMFLRGNHTLFNFGERRSTHLVRNQNLIMMDLNTDVIIRDINLYFYDTIDFQINNLVLKNGLFHIVMPQGTTNLSLFSVTLIDFVLYIQDATLAQLNDCVFTSGTNLLTTYRSEIVLSGNSTFSNNHNSAFVSYNSDITLSGTISFINNTGIRGGAMALYSSTVYLTSGLNISFINNTAHETGGAIHIDPDMTRTFCPKCFYHIQGQNTDIAFYYSENRAKLGGDNIYGTSLALCDNITRHLSSTGSMSSVSSDPMQVCLCNSDDQPQCKNVPRILTSREVYPGETFTIAAVTVGGDYGTTTGTVHASFRSTHYSSLPVLKLNHQYSQQINDISACTDLQYTIYSSHIGKNFSMQLTVHFVKNNETINKNDAPCDPRYHSYNSRTPAYINLTILPCPMGFSLFENPSTCDCHPVLTTNGVECKITNRKSYFSWNDTLWISVNPQSFMYAKYCPLYYCEKAEKKIELEQDSSAQCAFNRAGRLCGGCKEGYSLAIGSSHCIHCPNNNNLALLIFFTAAGFLLVFFINILDVTLTQGGLDGLIFYANIVWTYQNILFPEQHDSNGIIIFLKTFIAWLNLDFGIETCFVKGLTAYQKTWLQLVFPIYIWAVVGLMILTARHSKILTKIYGNRAVPVLATLILLSYMKLIRTVTSIYMFSDVIQYPEKSTVTVWSVDGNIDYFGLPHSLLLVAALIVQIFLWLPYTLILLFYQQLQKISHVKCFKWVTNLKPFFDVHFAPFKPAHRYWFGVLLLARGVLLAIFSSTFATPKNTNLLLLLILALILFFYIAIIQPYRNKVILLIQSSYIANILILCAFVFYAETYDNKYTLQITAIATSIGIIFSQFCAIIICNIIRLCYCTKRNAYRYRAHYEDEEELDDNFSTKYRTYVMKALF